MVHIQKTPKKKLCEKFFLHGCQIVTHENKFKQKDCFALFYKSSIAYGVLHLLYGVKIHKNP